MKNCPNLQKSLDWCEGTPQYPGIRRRLYYINKKLIELWPTLERDDFGRVIDAHYLGAFTIAADAAWQYIDINIDKSTVTSEPQGEVPSQTQLNKATFVHNGIDAEATAAAGYLNNADCVFVYEDMIGHFRVLGNNKWRTKITVNQDQGQGTNPASTTINIEVTDMIAPPFYVEGLETEDGEVFPSYDDEAVLEPRLTSPSGTTFDIGTISDSGSSVSKTMRIKGANLTQGLTLTKSGSGLTISKSSVTAEEANAGIYITLTYTKSTSGAGSLNGSLRIYSAEVDKTITVTARKAALTSPSASSIDVGTIASDGSSVQKSITIQGTNLSKAVSLRVTGSGFSLSKSSLTASQVNNGAAVIIYYANSSQGAASATGSLIISSDEVSKTIALTAAKEAPAATPVLTSPTINSLDLGTIASDETVVRKSITVRGENITQPVTITVSGTGFAAAVSSLTAAQVLAGYGLQLSYTNTASGAASATGSVRIHSSEGIDKTITLTAAKEAADVQPAEGPTNETPEGVMGLVFDPAMNVNGFFSDANVSSYPSSAKRQTVAVPVSEKFPAVPSNQRHYQDTSMDTAGGPEENFVLNTAFEDFAPIEAKNVKGFLSKTMGTKISHNSIFLLNPQKTGSGSNNYKETSVATSWRAVPQTEIINVANLSGYAATNKYYLCQNFKKTSGSTDTVMTQEAVYREDFDTIILPNTWRIHDLLETNYQSLFPKDLNYAGGMAIYDNFIVQVFTTGKIVVLNKTTLALVASGVMSIAADNMHGNAVSFGTTIPSGAVVPYLYVSQWTAGYCYCHVLKVTWTNGTVTTEEVQTISYSGTKFKTGTQYSNWDWSVDAKTGYIWCIGYASTATDRYGAKVALKFALPAIPTHAVTTQFTDSDIVKEFDFTFAGAQQDFHIENDLAFWEFSYNNGSGTGGVMIIDLANNAMLNNYIIDLQSTGREPEGVCRDGSLLYITSHQGGNNNFNLKLHVVDLLQTNLDEE